MSNSVGIDVFTLNLLPFYQDMLFVLCELESYCELRVSSVLKSVARAR